MFRLGFAVSDAHCQTHLEKARGLYKSSTLILGRSTPALSLAADGAGSIESFSDLASWTYPVASQGEASVRSSFANDDGAEADAADRMTLWIRNVESAYG